MNKIIIGVLISVIVISFYISSTNAQPWKSCIMYDSPTLIIINLNCGGAANSAIANYVAQGYDIKAANDITIYLTKTTDVIK